MGKADMEAMQAKIAAGEEKERKAKMKEKAKKMKEKKDGFFKDFKKFITKGNIVDMAVGVIVGSAFTAIINALSNGILKPIINWILASILGTDSLSEVYTYLKVAYTTDADTDKQIIDLANSIYIDWGTFVNAIINFFLVAMTLFVIARIARHVVNKAKARELEAAKAAEEKKKAEEKAAADAAAIAAAAAAAAAAEVAAKKEAELQAFYAHIARQTELLEQLSKK